ncbi:PhoX family protein [Streptomyces sp. NPDC057238]|uniref:PhoX family protein n=1 Tax=Streptomyces sp. NPDC057238 TaxID=3346060 RepID=UPI003628326C
MRDGASGNEELSNGREASGGPSRRGVVAYGALAATGLLAVGAPGAAAADGPGAADGSARRRAAGDSRPPLSQFEPVAASEADAVTVPAGYRADVIAPWGQRIRTSGADADGSTAQARQVGSHHHGIRYVPLADGAAASRHGLLVIGHEGADPALLGDDSRTAMAAQGVTVVEVRESGGTWRTVGSALGRRITADTPTRFSGPVAVDGGSRGVPAVSGVGVTPWGTCLAAEEDFHACFGTDDPAWRRTEEDIRYGLSATGFGHPWHRSDPRFDLSRPEADPRHFGWIVEFDPRDPSSAPVKRTALGRFTHGGATVTGSAGRAVVYSTDAVDGGHLYKYVSADGRHAPGRSPLDDGTLYVARLRADGTGAWLPLRHGHGPLTRKAGWRDQSDVLVRARLAADALGATALNRPERVAVSPVDGHVYLALAGGNGTARCSDSGAGSAVPRLGDADPHGRVVRWRETAGDGLRWEEFLSAGDQRSPEAAFLAPKGLWFDARGTLWISTGISGHALNGPGAAYREAGNNALLAADVATGTVRRFLTAPRGAEVTGVDATPDGQTLFVNIQHPGERTARWGAPDANDPRAVSGWPGLRPGDRPRSATVVVRRTAG